MTDRQFEGAMLASVGGGMALLSVIYSVMTGDLPWLCVAAFLLGWCAYGGLMVALETLPWPWRWHN